MKTPKGSNVGGTEVLESLMKTKDFMTEEKEQKKIWGEKLNVIISKMSCIANKELQNDTCEETLLACDSQVEEHNYDAIDAGDEAQGYISGWFAKNITKFTPCIDCIKSSCSDTPFYYGIYTKILNESCLS